MFSRRNLVVEDIGSEESVFRVVSGIKAAAASGIFKIADIIIKMNAVRIIRRNRRILFNKAADNLLFRTAVCIHIYNLGIMISLRMLIRRNRGAGKKGRR